jgi:hypothetical protein
MDSKKKIYRRSRGPTNAILASGFTGIALLTFVEAGLIQKAHTVADWTLVGTFLLGILAWILPIVIYFHRSRTILISDDGIGVLEFGRVKNVIPWKTVERIEVRRNSAASSRASRRSFCVYSAQGKLEFSQWIDQLENLLEEINHYVKQYGIRILQRDFDKARLSDAIRSLDSKERKNILKEGLVTRLPHL